MNDSTKSVLIYNINSIRELIENLNNSNPEELSKDKLNKIHTYLDGIEFYLGFGKRYKTIK